MSAANGLSGRRILVVEDEVMVSWLLEDMLGQLGCAVVGPAARVDQALAIIDGSEIDAAILDVNLNGEKSYPIADALAACGVPFVFSTGYGRKGLRDCYADVPMLQKPYKRSALGDALGTPFVHADREPPEERSLPAVWDAKRLRIATDAAGVALWSWNVDSDAILMDERAHGLWGMPIGPVTFADLSAHIHPETSTGSGPRSRRRGRSSVLTRSISKSCTGRRSVGSPPEGGATTRGSSVASCSGSSSM